MTRVAVVGGGVAGLAAAREVLRLCPGADLVVLEASHRLGGLVETERVDGYLVEHGPDSLTTMKPAAWRTVEELGLEGETVHEGEAPRRSYMVVGGGLVPIPEGLLTMSAGAAWSLLRSPLFSLGGRLRMTAEPFVPASRDGADESVDAFFRRRFGGEMAERLVDPLLRGIYQTPIDALSMQVAMPRMAALERKHGSVARGMARLRRLRREATGTPPPAMVTFGDGMGRLTDALASCASGHIRCGAPVRRLRREARGWRVDLADGGALDVEMVVLAAPAWAAAPMIDGADADLAVLLGEITHTPLLSVSLGFAREEVPHAMEGTGFVVSAGEARSISACTWSSRKWPGRAPSDAVLLRAFVRDADLSDAEAVDAMRRDLSDLMGIEAPPRFRRVRRRARGLPCPTVGHLARVEHVRARAAALGGLAFAGNAQGGVGVPDCIDSGVAAARALFSPPT